MLTTNKDRTVKIAVSGYVKQSRGMDDFDTDRNGRAYLVPGTGGITYNVGLGDSVFGWAGDHVEPGASCFNDRPDESKAFSALSCMGNHVRVLNGDAKGAVGFVCGQHGGVQHIMVHFHPDDLQKLAIDDRIQIVTQGQGLELCNFPDVSLHNIDPQVFEKIGIFCDDEGCLNVPVAGVIPSYLIGSGWGDVGLIRGRDCDFMASDWDAVLENHLETLKFGDLVLIQDMESCFGRQYVRGAATVGVIIHSDSPLAGHGPGITTFMTTVTANRIKPIIDPSANLLKFHDLAYGPLEPLKQ